MRSVFFGTPEIAVPTLEALAKRPALRPLLVITQPSARRSRRGAAEPSPVAARALELGLEVVESDNVNEGLAYERLLKASPDLIVVVSFGQILKKRVLDLPRHGCLNFHPSLLPKFRGAAPVQRAVMAGERESGLTVMRLVKKLDAGPILAQRPWTIGDTGSAEQLLVEAGELGAPMMCDVMNRLDRGEVVVARDQDDSQATYAPPLLKSDGILDWRKSGRVLSDLVRGVQPWPRASAELNTQSGPRRIIVHAAKSSPLVAAAGQLHSIDESGIVVGCGEGSLCLTQVQLEGKSVQSGRALANGLRLLPGATFVVPESNS